MMLSIGVNFFGGKLKLILISKAIQYVAIRYVSYLLNFINTILILSYLGDYSYGLYSFFVLFLSYFTYLNLGVNHSLNTYLSVHKADSVFVCKLWDNAFILSVLFSFLIVVVGWGVHIFYPDIFAKYEFKNYAVIIFFLGIVTNVNSIFVALFRVYGKLREINFQQIVPQILVLGVILALREETKIHYVLYAMFIAQFLSLVLFLRKKPLQFHGMFDLSMSKKLVVRGTHLMIQLFSFTFISISAITMVSYFYQAEDLGYYSLANTISISVMMLIDAFMFILYPKILNRFANSSNEETVHLLDKIRHVYILGADSISLLSLLVVPIMFLLAPQYEGMITCFKLLTISRIIVNVTNGYTQLLIARHKESYMTLGGMLAIALIVVICSFIGLSGVPYYYMAFAVCLGILFYSFFIIRKAFTILNLDKGKLWANLFPMHKSIAICIILISFILNDNVYTPVIAVGYYMFMNRKAIQYAMISAYRTLVNKEVLSI